MQPRGSLRRSESEEVGLFSTWQRLFLSWSSYSKYSQNRLFLGWLVAFELLTEDTADGETDSWWCHDVSPIDSPLWPGPDIAEISVKSKERFSHLLQLAVHHFDTVTTFKELLKHTHALVRKVNSSTKATEWLISLCGKKLIRDCPTRWSSTFLLIEHVLEVKASLITVLEELEWDSLATSEWKILEGIKIFTTHQPSCLDITCTVHVFRIIRWGGWGGGGREGATGPHTLPEQATNLPQGETMAHVLGAWCVCTEVKRSPKVHVTRLNTNELGWRMTCTCTLTFDSPNSERFLSARHNILASWCYANGNDHVWRTLHIIIIIIYDGNNFFDSVTRHYNSCK